MTALLHANPIVSQTLGLQFLAPMTGLVAASLAIPAFLFFYFLKLRRRPMRVSSTLFWEQAVNDLQVNAPIRWIRPSVLLFIQLLALICLILAAARPALEGGPMQGRVVLLIDASASMSSMDDQSGLSRLQKAQAAAREYLDSLPSETRVMVIEIAGQTRTLTNFTRNRGVAAAAIDGIAPSDQPARLADALEVLTAFVSRPGEEGGEEPDDPMSAPPRVVLFSDGAFPDPAEDRSAPGLGSIEFEFVYTGPEFPAESVEPLASENVAIIGLSVRRDLDDPETIRVFTRLQSTFRRERPVTLRCSVDGEVVAVATPTLPSAKESETDNRIVPTSESTFTFDINRSGGGLLSVSVGIDDALESDNRAWLVLPPPRSLRLLMIREDGPLSNGSANLAFALETLYPEPDLVRVISASEATREGLISGPGDSDFDVVVYDSVTPPTLPVLPALYFDAVPPDTGLRIDRSGVARSSEFLYWRRSHPVMRNVVPDGVLIYERGTLSLPEAESADPERSSGVVRTTELASDPTPLIALVEHGRTRSLAVAFDLDATNWWQDRSFPIFVQNAIDFLAISTDAQTGRAIRTSEPIRLSGEEIAGGATLVDEDGNTLRISPPPANEPVTIPPVRRAGIYELLPSEDSGGTPRLVAVNLLDPFESLTAAIPRIEIGGETASGGTGNAQAQREIWNWFVLAAVLLLTLEWLLFDRKMRV